MSLRNAFENFDFGEIYAPKKRRNAFSGAPEDPAAANQQRFLEQAGTYEQPAVTANAGPPQPSGPDWGNWMSELRDAYTKEGPAQSAYKEHLGQMPEYQTPSKWGKFGAALVGGAEGLRSGAASGWRAAQEAATAPYKRELGQWAAKEQALGRNVAAEDKASQRRIDFMNTARQMSKDEREYGKWMRDYDFKLQQEANDENQRAAERGRWDRQDLETYTDEQGNLRERMPGSTGPGRLVGASDKAADIKNAAETRKIGWANVGVANRQAATGEGNLRLGQERESRIASTPMDPNAQATARSSALQRAATEKSGWADFIDPETGMANPPRRNDPEKWQEFQNFLRRAESIEGGIFNKPRYPPIIDY